MSSWVTWVEPGAVCFAADRETLRAFVQVYVRLPDDARSDDVVDVIREVIPALANGGHPVRVRLRAMLRFDAASERVCEDDAVQTVQLLIAHALDKALSDLTVYARHWYRPARGEGES